MFKKKDKWHDGYYLTNNGDIQFYRDSALSKVSKGSALYLQNSQSELSLVIPPKIVAKVNQEKIVEYEGFCKVYHDEFLRSGMLRLHTPIDIHQEHLGI